MGQDKVRHVRLRKGRLYWIPSATLERLGYSCEPLGLPSPGAYARAMELNARSQADRAAGRVTLTQELPASCVKRLAAEYEKRGYELTKKLKDRTKRDYDTLMPVIVESFGMTLVEAMSAKVVTTWLGKEPNDWRRYHLGLMVRTFLKWCKAEEYLKDVPEFVVSTPAARKVLWQPAQILACADSFEALKWPSLSVGFLVEWCIGQNPCDVWSLKRSAYVGDAIDVTRSKTGVGGDPIPLWPLVRERLDAYLADSPALPEAFLFRNEKTGTEWVESTRAKWFARARAKAELPTVLQMRDLRRTAITEALSLGFSRGQTRSLSRHSNDSGMEPYDALHKAGMVATVQQARGALAIRTDVGQKLKLPKVLS